MGAGTAKDDGPGCLVWSVGPKKKIDCCSVESEEGRDSLGRLDNSWSRNLWEVREL